VPILRYVDTQNVDGSYTYGYEAADGTYKIETRYVDGRVKGKYGYIDPDGQLREASYGAEAGRGFEPQIEGVELPAPVTAAPAPLAARPAPAPEVTNEIPNTAALASQQKRFRNFQPVNTNNNNKGRFTIKNGRRALVKKVRRVKATPAPKQFIDEQGAQAARQANLKARQQQLRVLEEHRRQLLTVQQQQQQQQRPQQTSFRQQQRQQPRQLSLPAARVEQSRSSSVADPYISGLDLASGSYSYSY